MSATSTGKPANQPFGGYYKPADRPVDDELARVSKGTPCGEYLRRFWQPIMMTERVGVTPLALRILGEDLILFRDLSGRLGLMDRYCSHRGMSLEYGIIAERGIRCAYHAWMYDCDGRILETPGEPPTSRIKDTVCQGAYPVVEYKGLIFAYFGPPELKPEFPRLDMMELPDNEMLPWQIHSPCNWLQVSENSMDPYHTPFLHTRMSGTQFEDVWGELPVIDLHDREFGFYYTNARRSGNNIWVRIHDHLVPNFSQNGGLFERGEQIRYFGRSSLTRWVVPIDDTNTFVIAWRNVNRRDDPEGRTKRDEIGWEKVDFYGQSVHRPYEMRQAKPSDYDAWAGQGPINSHAREHLGWTDQFVAQLRRRIRNDIRTVQKGNAPEVWRTRNGMPTPTHAGDTVLHIPRRNQDDRQLILDTSKRIADAYEATQNLPDGERRKAIEEKLAPLNV
ncbi:MAG: aromatic ring-hydroxylating dioxygenase subunit alpha [Alphaproteobacteria bacterium]|nr:aromatic ring-hydroxylating dioxygenase subunit alpha [Alphaproteobacteria bacterium]